MKEFIATEEPMYSIAKRKCKIHGSYRLPKGYEFAFVPTDAVIAPLEQIPETERVSIELSTSNSSIKTCLAILQTAYAAYSVYRARGDQIAVYGYAAFGLTVIPYIMMSVLNLVAQIVSDDYPMLYMIRTPEMDEAIGRGGIFHGAVAKLEPWAGGIDDDPRMVLMDSNSGPWRVQEIGTTVATFQNQNVASPQHLQRIQVYRQKTSARRDVYIPNCTKFRRQGQVGNSIIDTRYWRPDHLLGRRIPEDKFYLHSFFWPLGLSLVSFVLLGGLSQFHKGTSSTIMERGFTMSWLIAGMLFGFLFKTLIRAWQGLGISLLVAENKLPLSGNLWRTILRSILWILANLIVIAFGLVLLVFCVPAIGGFVMVGKMILEYGSCTRV